MPQLPSWFGAVIQRLDGRREEGSREGLEIPSEEGRPHLDHKGGAAGIPLIFIGVSGHGGYQRQIPGVQGVFGFVNRHPERAGAYIDKFRLGMAVLIKARHRAEIHMASPLAHEQFLVKHIITSMRIIAYSIHFVKRNE